MDTTQGNPETDKLERLRTQNQFDNQKRWPKVLNYLKGFQARMQGILGVERFDVLSQHFNQPLIEAAYREALRIHGEHTREEYIGEYEVEYILHIEEVLNYFLGYVAILCEKNPDQHERFCTNISEMICAVMLHDSIEDYPLEEGQKWDFKSIFSEVLGNIRKNVELPQDSEEAITWHIWLLTKDKTIDIRAERNAAYYDRFLEFGEIATKIQKLSDIRNNGETTDECRILSRPRKKIIEFVNNLHGYIESDNLPQSLQNNQYLEYTMFLADTYEVTSQLRDGKKPEEFDELELNILTSLYIWSKIVGYMLHLEPPNTQPTVLPDGSSYIKPDFLTEEELAIEGVVDILEDVKQQLQNPEKLILPYLVVSRIRLKQYLSVSLVEPMPDENSDDDTDDDPGDNSKTERSSEPGMKHIPETFYNLVAGSRKSLAMALENLVDQALARIHTEHGRLVPELINAEVINVVNLTRAEVAGNYEESGGHIPPRGKIGPRMTSYLADDMYLAAEFPDYVPRDKATAHTSQ